MSTTAPVPRAAPSPRPSPSAAPAASSARPSPTAHTNGVQAPARTSPTSGTVPPRGTVAPIAGAKPAGKVSKLGEVRSGVLDEAQRFFLYGTRGVGKSTLAADIPGAITFDLDLGSGHLAMKRYPFDPTDPSYEPTYQDVLDGIDDLTVNAHSYTALVIDEASKLESLLWNYIVANAAPDKGGNKPTSIEEVGGGFQKGYVVAEQEWRSLLAKLDRLRLRRRMHIVILGHAHVAKVKNPTGEDYGKHAPMIHEKAVGAVAGNADVVGFVTFADIAKRLAKGKTVGHSGRRVVHLEHTAAVEAKCRLPMAPMIDLPESSPWAPFAQAIEDLRTMTPASMRTAIIDELARLGENFTRENGTTGTAAIVRTAVARAGDNVGDLHRYLTILQQSEPITADEEQPQ